MAVMTDCVFVCVHDDVEQELYNLRSVYGQRKRALEFCNSTFTTIGEKKFCILHLLEDVKVRTLHFPAPYSLLLSASVCPEHL